MDRTLNQVMLEGQERTLELMGLKNKQVAGTLTVDETARMNLLEGNLLALANEAQGLGLDTGAILDATRARVQAEQNPVEVDEDEDYDPYEDEYDEGLDLDEDEDILGLNDEPYLPFGGNRLY